MKNTDYCTLDKGQLPEVAKSRLKEYKAIRAKVDAKAKRRTRKELGMPNNQWWFGSCHTFWKHKKRILREEYHMIWRSPKTSTPNVVLIKGTKKAQPKSSHRFYNLRP